MLGPKNNLGLIGLAVLTFIDYKQTNRQAKYTYIDLYQPFCKISFFYTVD